MEGDRRTQGAQLEGIPMPDLFRVFSHEDFMRCCGWRHVAMCRGVSRSMKEAIEDGEDGWRRLAAVMAAELGLFIPSSLDSSWRGYFWEHLFPARHKWADQEEKISDYRIRVAIRFKAGEEKERSDLVLPLHQRLKMLKKGEKISREEANGEKGLSLQEVQDVLAKDGDSLDPEVLQMLCDARQLTLAATRAEQDAANRRIQHSSIAATPSGSADGLAPDAARQHGDAGMAAAAADAWHAEGGGREAGGGEASKQASEEQDENDGQGRQQGKARILAVEQTKVAAFVPGVGIRPFRFTQVLGKATTQAEAYCSYARNAAISALNGFNACVLAYGQTGSGKTYTMFGPPGLVQGLADADVDQGVAIRSVEEVLAGSKRLAAQGLGHVSLRVSYVQVYREEVFDLLAGGKVGVRGGGEKGYVLQGAEEAEVRESAGLWAVLREGEARKQYAATAMNERSSRAHTLLIVNLTHVRAAGGAAGQISTSQLILADLAGSEQIKKSKAVGAARHEAASINSALFVLKRCITALNESRPHVPFLESKLTMLLKGALGGASRTYCMVCASMDSRHADESVDAMRFGEACANITNHVSNLQLSSLPAALSAIDDALARCDDGMRNLKARGRTHLPAFQTLQAKRSALARKRALLSLNEPTQTPIAVA